MLESGGLFIGKRGSDLRILMAVRKVGMNTCRFHPSLFSSAQAHKENHGDQRGVSRRAKLNVPDSSPHVSSV